MYYDEPPYEPRNHLAPSGYSQPRERPRPSAETEAIIRELDIRFPPNATISEADRETQVLLLASDVADIPPKMLRIAAREWVRTKAFMPKASELRVLAREALPAQTNQQAGATLAAKYNAAIEADPQRARHGLRWVYEPRTDHLKLVPLSELEGAYQ